MPFTVSMTIAQLKALFESGDKPTGADFASLIESTYGRDQLLQFNPVSGDLGISTSDGAPYNIVNIADMLDANLSFTYNNSTRKLTVTRNGIAIVLGPFDGPWTVLPSNKAHTNRWIGIGNSNPGYPLHVNGNAKIEGKTTVTGDLFADKDLQIGDNLRFGGHAEEVDRITDVINTATSSSNALTTENAVIEFMKKHSWQHVLLVDLIPTAYSTGATPAIVQVNTFNPIVWDTNFINSSSAFMVPAGMEGLYSFHAHIIVTVALHRNNYQRFWLRRNRGGSLTDIRLFVSDYDAPNNVISATYEMRMQAGDQFSLIVETNGAINNHLTGQFSVKRLPDPIL